MTATMASLLTKKLTSLNSPFPSYRHNNLTFLTPLFHFSTQIQQNESHPFIAQYLISSFGFSEERALRVATQKALARIKTPDRPESVVRFLKDTGLTDTEIKKAVSWAPQLLARSVSKSLEPSARDVIAAGFTQKTLIQLIKYNPLALDYNSILSHLQFWRNFVGNSEEVLLKLLKSQNGRLICMDADKRIIPRINLLRQYGLSDPEIAKFITETGCFLNLTADSIKSKFEQIEKLGFIRGSKMFLQGLIVFGCLHKDTLDRKIRFFKTNYGWSEEDINLAIRKFPRILCNSQEKISSVMDFLIREVGFNSRSVALQPALIAYSLERRLIPRHYVLTVLKLKANDLKHRRNFLSLCVMSEKLFAERFILPYKEELPDLEEEYAAACAGTLPLSMC